MCVRRQTDHAVWTDTVQTFSCIFTTVMRQQHLQPTSPTNQSINQSLFVTSNFIKTTHQSTPLSHSHCTHTLSDSSSRHNEHVLQYSTMTLTGHLDLLTKRATAMSHLNEYKKTPAKQKCVAKPSVYPARRPLANTNDTNLLTDCCLA